MITEGIHRLPTASGAVAILEAAALPSADLTPAHMEHFFYCGSASEPTALVGLEICGPDALLRSLVVAPDLRSSGIGSALIARAEEHARASGLRAIFLLTTTAEAFFKRRGYIPATRADAPAAIRATREFMDLCPASAVFLFKPL